MKMVGTARKIFVIINVDWFFRSHFMPLFIEIKKEGYEVSIVSKDTGEADYIRSCGFEFVDISVKRSGIFLWSDLLLFFQLVRLYRNSRPAIIEHVTVKLCILGTVASIFASQSKVVNYLCGLGYAFTPGSSFFVRKIAEWGIQIVGIARRSTFVVENEDDLCILKRLIKTKRVEIAKINGVGIDLKKVIVTPYEENKGIQILFPARILVNKGVYEFIEAAELCRLNHGLASNVRFLIAGKIDEDSRYHINEDTLRNKLMPNYIEWLGHCNNMDELMSTAAIIVLPSYREGLPKSLVEACAASRPIITTDVPGCRECVEEGGNGFFVPVGNAKLLAERMMLLINNSELRKKMGKRSRELAVQRFSLESISEETIKLFKRISIE